MVYLDHAATTPISEVALAALIEASQTLGNASSLHSSGRKARRIVEESREEIAMAIDAQPSDVIFTSSGTEANNLALKGLYWQRPNKRILSSAIEHHAVLDPINWLVQHEDAKVTWAKVDQSARIDSQSVIDDIEADPDISFISLMAANNEVGTIQPISEIVEVAHKFGIPVHVDAVQAFGKIPLSFALSNVDAMTISAHKIGGPLGVGALIAKKTLALTPVLHGGGQERDVRSGTLNMPSIRAFAVAASESIANLQERHLRVSALRQNLINRIINEVPQSRCNGSDDQLDMLPGIAHFTFPGAEGDALLLLLDAQGVEASTGSACSAGVPRPSHVLLAMGMSESEARASLRFSLGASSTTADVDKLVAVLPGVVERARQAGHISRR